MIQPEASLNPQQLDYIRKLAEEISSLPSGEQDTALSGIRTNPEAACLEQAAKLLAGVEGQFAYREMRDRLLDVLLSKDEASEESGNGLKAAVLYALSPMPEMTARGTAVCFPSLPEEIARSQVPRGELKLGESGFDLAKEAMAWSRHHSAHPDRAQYPYLAVLLMPRNMQEWADNVAVLDQLLADRVAPKFSLYEIQKTLNFALVSAQRYLAIRAAQSADGVIPKRDAALFKQGLDTLYQGALGINWMSIRLNEYPAINGAAMSVRQSVIEGAHLVFKRRFAGGFLMNRDTGSIESHRFVYPLLPEQAFGPSENLTRSISDNLSEGVVDHICGGAVDFTVNVGQIEKPEDFGNYIYLDGTPEQEQAALTSLYALYDGSRQAFRIHEAAIYDCGEQKEILRTNLVEAAVAISKHDNGAWFEYEGAVDRLLYRAAGIVASGTVSEAAEVIQCKAEINSLRSLVANEDKVLPSSAFSNPWVRPALYNRMMQTFFRSLRFELEQRPQTETKTLDDISILAQNLKEKLGQQTINSQLSHLMQYVLTAPMLCPNTDMSRSWFFEKMNDGLNKLVQTLEEPIPQSSEPGHDAFNRFKEAVRFQENMDRSVEEVSDNLDNLTF